MYSILCKQYDEVYIGQSKRRITVRQDVCEVAVANQMPTFVVYQNLRNHKHEIAFANSKLISSIDNFKCKTTKRQIKIAKRKKISLPLREQAQQYRNTTNM